MGYFIDTSFFRFYALTDADPYGIDIAGIYAFGSLKNTRLQLELTGLRWIGFLPSEIDEYVNECEMSSKYI